MTAYTTNYAIPYPQGADAPCALDDVLSDAADAICSMTELVDAAVNHMADRPVIKVSAGSGQVLTFGTYAPRASFTAVDIDTESTVDLALEPNSVPFPVGYDGLYLTGYQLNAPGVNVGGPVVYISTLNNRASCGDETGSSGTIGSACCTMDIDLALAGSSGYDRLSVSTGGSATTMSPTHVELYIVSISD